MTDISVEGLRVSLLGNCVIRDVTFRTNTGSWMSLIGPNGAGKTTLLRAIAGGVAHRGQIRFDGAMPPPGNERARAKTVAVVPQSPHRPTGMRVIDYVLLGRSPYVPYLGMERFHDLDITKAQLERLDLVDLADRPVSTLSGGEFQRAVLARALAQQAPVLLLDEPTSSLDLGHAQQVLELVDELRHERNLTVISALHDLALAGQYSDELVLLADGQIVARGPAREVLTAEQITLHYQANVHVVVDEVAGPVLIPRRPVLAAARARL